eukprot:scaffold323803_cov31-Tisochrysis_lutea.AAC.6
MSKPVVRRRSDKSFVRGGRLSFGGERSTAGSQHIALRQAGVYASRAPPPQAASEPRSGFRSYRLRMRTGSHV